jgi:hypothetical protein
MGGKLVKNLQNTIINLAKPALAIMTSAFFITGMAGTVYAVDNDSDGMPDDFEIFYGLDPNNAADALVDLDADGVTNLQESAIMTDPFAPDTDRDGWNDNVDSNAISRAYIQWGAPNFTVDDAYEYAHPAWLLGAYKVDGDWLTNTPTCWHVSSNQTDNVGSLNVDLDRSILTTNNLRYKITFFDHLNASLYVDLIDTNEVVVASNLFGNLNYNGSNVESTVTLNIPLAAYSNAAVIHLRRGIGESTVYVALLCVDEDGDGLDREQEAQLGTSDYDTDSDDDGLSDYDEVFVYGTNPMNADTDGDGMKDGWEVQHGLNPNVNDAAGDKDGDGVNNLTEYLQGRDPAAGATSDTNGVVNLKVYTTLE